MWAGPGGMGEQGRWGGAWRRLGLSGESEPAPTMTLPFTLLESRVDFRGRVAQWLVCPLAGPPRTHFLRLAHSVASLTTIWDHLIFKNRNGNHFHFVVRANEMLNAGA